MPKHLTAFLTCFALIVSFLFYTKIAQAGGGRIELSNPQSGYANVSPAPVMALVYNEERTQVSPGEEGYFSFENPQAGQYCVSPESLTDSQGKIYASCFSSVGGDFIVKFTLVKTNEVRTMSISFRGKTQTLSGSYRLESSTNSVSFTNELNTGYGINVFLKDAQSGETIIHQEDITYSWTMSSDVAYVQTTSRLCISPVEEPCPNINGQIEGYKPGSTTLTVKALKSGQTIASTSIPVTVSQASKNPRYTTPTPSPSPTPTPTAVVKASPSPSASVKTSPKASASPKASPTSEPVEEATAGGLTDDSASPTPSPSSTPAAAGTTTDNDQSGIPWAALALGAGVIVGIGIPIGWYVLEENPDLKARLLNIFDRNPEGSDIPQLDVLESTIDPISESQPKMPWPPASTQQPTSHKITSSHDQDWDD